MEKLNVLVVDDSIVFRNVLSMAVEKTGMATVVQTASNGLIAIERMRHDNIDVVLMDVNMPQMDGIEALKLIKKGYTDTEVILISGDSSNSAKITLKALEYGAIDFILKPLESSQDKNIEKISKDLQMLFTQIMVKKLSVSKENEERPVTSKKSIEIKKDTDPKFTYKTKKLSGVDLVLIASSTGGPVALETICKSFSDSINSPIIIVQHMPPKFTKMMAESLNKNCKLEVIEGQDEDSIKQGRVIVSKGGFHTTVNTRKGFIATVKTENTPSVNGVRPAADVLFDSAAREYAGKNILVVILTGMGSDGTKGVMNLKKSCNCYCITQSQETCVVYGMPRSVFEAGLSDEVCDIGDIAKRIEDIATGKG